MENDRSWPPIESSLAVTCCQRQVVQRDERRCVTIEFADVYPNGLHVRMEARFRDAISLEEQKTIASQWAFQQSEDSRPSLKLLGGGQDVTAHVLNNTTSGGLLKSDLWAPLDTGSVTRDLELEFTWPPQHITSTTRIQASHLASALGRWEKLWSARQASGYFASNSLE